MPKAKPDTFYVLLLTVDITSGVPFDMMRYDSAVPATEEDSFKLNRIADDCVTSGDRTVTFRVFSRNATINEARWNSFGCRIVSLVKAPREL